MALPSQSTFGNSRFMATKPRRAARPRRSGRIIAIGVLLTALIGWWVVFRPGSDIGSANEPAGAVTASTQPSEPLTRDSAARNAARTPTNVADRTSTTGETSRSLLGSAPTPRTIEQPALTEARPAPSRTEPNTPPAMSPPLGGAIQPSTNSPEPAAPAPGATSGPVQSLLDEGRLAWAQNKPIPARDALNRALHHRSALPAQQSEARRLLTEISLLATFSPRVLPDDPMAETYEIKSGDLLSRVVRDSSLQVDWRLITRLNNIQDPRRIRVGQKIKLLRGPFHATVHKSLYRMDLYADLRDSAGNRIYLRSFPVGLGEYDSTPVGKWIVRENSRLINPHWINPRTRERFDADDPMNPIGERWIGLEGIDDFTRTAEGYGIHGTIEPESIGRQESMGCIRMLPDDVELVYELLIDRVSKVEVLP